jgi:anti-sigma regulatory factor (Ser/Thr protein kinase)
MSVSAVGLPVAIQVDVEGDLDAAVALMTPHGSWNRPLREYVVAALRRCLAEHPEALIVDLSGLSDPGAESAATWVAAQNAAAAMDPPVQLALCIPPDLPLADRMQRLATGRYLPVYAKVRQARVAIAGRLPVTERLTMTLAPDPDAPSVARNLAGDACLAWAVPELLHPARLVMSELVTNAVEHARTTVTVGVSRRGAGIHLTVADGLATLPRLREPARPRRDQPLDDRGRGLRVVTATATAWGALPTRTGKVVWATLRLHHPPLTELR